MTRRFRTSFPKQGPTKIGQKIALMQCILNRQTLDEPAVQSLIASFGHGEGEVRAMVAEELARREARRVA